MPFKNRKLFEYTIDKIPRELFSDTYITTDDEEIVEKASKKGLNVIKRSKSLAEDTTSTKSVMLDALKKINVDSEEQVVMLYLTYPERTWSEVQMALKFFEDNEAKSLLCKKNLKVSPYLCMVENGIRGNQLIKHDLYRRQDYPKCFEISHFICIFKAAELNNLNNNMYNSNTIFYKIQEVVDVDKPIDLEEFYGKNYS